MNKMKVEIWSDVMCPFCYIGKRHFEKALAQFENKSDLEVIWKSFQLNPHQKTDPDKSVNQYLSEVKGWSLEQAAQAHAHVTQMAREAGLEYHMDRAVVANSFDAHRLIQMAKHENKGDAAEEALFKAYFTDGKNTADHQVLLDLGVSIGLDRNKTAQMLNSSQYAADVKKDIDEASQLGLRGVPFFVIDRKYGISGAQPSPVFLNALNTAFSEWQKNSPIQNINTTEGPSCDTEGNCD